MNTGLEIGNPPLSPAIIMIDESGVVHSLNPETERIFGFSREEMLGNNINLLMPEPLKSRHNEFLRNYFNSRRGSRVCLELKVKARRKDGALFPAELVVLKLPGEGDNLLCGIIRDVSVDATAHEGANALSRFSLMMGHEIKDSMRKIVSFSDRLMDCSGLEADMCKEYAMRIQKNALGIQSFVERLFELVQSEGDRATAEVDLNRLFKEARKELEEEFMESGADLSWGDLPQVVGNEMALRFLFKNLLANAIKYRREDMPLVIRVTALKNGRDVWEIRVKDNGKGFEPGDAEVIFQPFTRLNPGVTEGKGLGLAICRAIAESHYGTIRVEGDSGKGACFIISLPDSLSTAA